MASHPRVAGLLGLCITAFFLPAGASPSAPAPPPRSPEELQSRVADAFRTRDPEAFLALFCWDRVGPTIRQSQETCLRAIVADTLESIRFQPWGASDRSELMTMYGEIYRLNLPPAGTLQIDFAGATERSWPVGTLGSSYQLAFMVVADTLVGVEEDTVWKNPLLTVDERDHLDDYYRGDMDVDELITPAVDDAEALLPTLQHRGARLLKLYLEDALDAETSGRAAWLPTPFMNGPSHVNRARDLRESIASRLDRPLPACAFPVAEFYLKKETSIDLQLNGMRILSRVEGTAADSLILATIDHPTGNDRIALEALLAASHRGLRPSPQSLAYLGGRHRPTLADSARALDARLGYSPIPPFDPDRALRSPQVQALLDSLDSLWIVPLPPTLPFIELRFTPGCGDTLRWDARYGWLERTTPDSIGILSPSGSRFTVARADTFRTLDGAATGCRTVTSSALTPSDIAARYRTTFEPSFFEHADSDLERAVIACWLERQGESHLAAGILIPLLDRYMSDEQFLEHISAVLGVYQGYRMFVAFVGDRDYPRAMEEARRLLARYPDTMFSKYAEQFLVELPRRMDDYHSFRLPTPEEWMALRATMSREEQIDFLCSCLRLVTGCQWGQPGGVTFSCAQTAEPQGLAEDASWCLERGRTEVINPWVELSGGDSWTQSRDSLGITLGIADIPRLTAHLRDDWFVPGMEFWRDFRAERHLYRTSQLLAALICEIAQEPIIDADDWPLLNESQRGEKIQKVVHWAGDNASRSEEERFVRQLENAENWYYAERLLPKLYEYKRKDLVPQFLSFLARKETNEFNRESIFRACRTLDPARAASTAKGYLNDPSPGVQIQAAIIQIEAGDKVVGLKVVADALAQGTNSTLSQSSALDGLRVLLQEGSEPCLRQAEVVLERSYFLGGWESDQATLLKELITARSRASYQWLLASLQDTTLRGGTDRAPLRRQDWAAQLAADYFIPRDLGIAYDFQDPADTRAQGRSRMIAWLTEQMATLPPGN